MIPVDHCKPCFHGMKPLLFLFHHSFIAKSRWIVGGMQQLKIKVNILSLTSNIVANRVS